MLITGVSCIPSHGLHSVTSSPSSLNPHTKTKGLCFRSPSFPFPLDLARKCFPFFTDLQKSNESNPNCLLHMRIPALSGTTESYGGLSSPLPQQSFINYKHDGETDVLRLMPIPCLTWCKYKSGEETVPVQGWPVETATPRPPRNYHVLEDGFV